MTFIHQALIARLQSVCREEGTDEVVLVSEWLGYLPYGQYCWLNVGSRNNIDSDFQDIAWSNKDLDVLEEHGFLERIEHTVRSEDGLDTTTRYRLVEASRGEDS